MVTEDLQELQRQWLATIAGKGGRCPVCDRFGKIYKYKLSQALARALEWIVQNGGTEGWVNVQESAPRWILRSKTYPLLEHWSMVESQGKRSGVWRATQLGKSFVAGFAVAPSAVYVYDDKLFMVDSEHTSFGGCFGVNFNFEEMMSSSLKDAQP